MTSNRIQSAGAASPQSFTNPPARLAMLLALAWAPLAQAHAQTGSEEERQHTLTLETVEVVGTHSPYTSESSVGGKEPVRQREIANSVSVITEQRIKDQNLQTVGEALNQATGVTVITNDTTQSQYYSRGYSLGVSYDGIPHTNSFSGVQQLDLPVYEQVEVLRGPAGVFAGSDDPGGTVNLVRKRARSVFGLNGAVSAASWANYRGELDVTGPLNEARTVRYRAVFSARDRDYFYEKTHTRKLLGYGTIDWDITPATTASFAVTIQDDNTDAPSLGLPAYSDTGGLLNVPRKTNPIADWSESNWDTKDYIAELEHRFDNRWTAKLKFNRRDQNYFFKDGFVTSALNRETNMVDYRRRIVDVDYQRDAVDLFLSGPFSLFGREHRALFGYNWSSLKTTTLGYGNGLRNRDFVRGVLFNSAIEEVSGDYHNGSLAETRQSGVYGQLRLNVTEPLTVVLGGRLSNYDNRSRSIAPSTPSDWSQGAEESSHFTPYVGVIYDLNKTWSVYGSYSSIFIPQTYERSGGGTLDPREGRQWEGGVKGELLDGRLLVSAAYFDLRDKNRPYEDPNDPDYYLARGKVQSRGWEFEASGRPWPGYEIQAGYARLDTKYLEDDSSQGEIFDTWEPRHSLKLWGLKHFGQGRLNGLSVGLGGNVYSESSAGTGSSAIRRQGGYAVVNALLRYRFSEKLSLQFNANNLFDRTYYTRLGGTNTYNNFGEPRNFSVTLRAQY